MNYSIFLSIVAASFGILAFFPYIRDIVNKKTKPHLYTWLIWSITQGIGFFAVLKGGGGWASLSLGIGTLLVFATTILSIKRGTSSITKFDTGILLLAIGSIFVWWKFNQPVVSVVLVSLIDVIGYVPTFRKAYHNPWSETLTTWGLFSASNLVALSILEQFNLLTVTYLLAMTSANIVLICLCLVRRNHVSRV